MSRCSLGGALNLANMQLNGALDDAKRDPAGCGKPELEDFESRADHGQAWSGSASISRISSAAFSVEIVLTPELAS